MLNPDREGATSDKKMKAKGESRGEGLVWW